MTISTTGNSQVFPGNGATTVFTFTFTGGSTAWITVIYTAADGTQTNVTASTAIALNAPTGGALWGVGGTVTYNPSGSPIASGTSLTVTRTIPLTQLTAFANQNSVYNTVTEESFDTLVMQLQQINTTLLTSYNGTSTTSLTIGTGTQSLTVQTGLGFAPGMFVTIAYQTTPSNLMQGVVTSYNSSTGALVVNVSDTSGTGTFASWFVALSGAPEVAPITLSGDVTGTGTTAITTTIAANAVSSAKFRQSVALSVVGNSTNATANVADIAAASDGQVLRRNGTAVSFGALSLSTAAAVTGQLVATSMPALTGDVTTAGGALGTTIAANAVTFAKFQQVAAVSLVGNATGSLANATGITLGSTLTFSGSALQTTALTSDVTSPANSFVTTVAKIAGTTVSGTTGTTNVVFSASPTFTGTAAFAALSASGQITSTATTGTAPLVVASTTNVANLNASSLGGATFAAPGAIGGGTAAAITGTTITGNSFSATGTSAPAGAGIYQPTSSSHLGIAANSVLVLDAYVSGGTPLLDFYRNSGVTATFRFISSASQVSIVAVENQPLSFFTAPGGVEEQVRITRTASATNFLTLTGSNAAAPAISTSGGGLTISSSSGTTTFNDATIKIPSLAQTSAAQSGTVCYHTTNGITYDATLGCLTSSLRFKEQIKPLSGALENVMKLRPISYVRTDQPEEGEQIWLGAEDVADIDRRLVGLDPDGNPLGVRQAGIVALLISAVQDLQKARENSQKRYAWFGQNQEKLSKLIEGHIS